MLHLSCNLGLHCFQGVSRIQWVSKNSKCDQEIPQSQTADNPVDCEIEPLNHHDKPGRKNKQSNQLSLPHQDDCNTRTDTKQRAAKHRTVTDSHNGSNNKQLEDLAVLKRSP